MARKKKLTDEEIEDLLIGAHQNEADRLGITIRNFGWGQTDYGICSKTTGGYLESEIDPDTLKVIHDLEEY